MRLTLSSSVAASTTRSASPRSSKRRREADPLERRLHVGLGDEAAADLPGHVALDRAERLVERVFLLVVEDDVVAGERDDMGDPVAHLAGTDDADLLDEVYGRRGAGLFGFHGSVHVARSFRCVGSAADLRELCLEFGQRL